MDTKHLETTQNAKGTSERHGSEPNQGRRTVAKSLAGIAALSVISRTRTAKAQESEPDVPDELRIASLAELDGGDIIDFQYPAGHAAFAVKLPRAAAGGAGPEARYVAFHRACPHMGCPLGLIDPARGQCGPCPCHRSTFDMNRGGIQIYGVASQPMVQIMMEVRDGDLFAVGVRGLPYGQPLTTEHAP